jgi:hypothetical protein
VLALSSRAGRRASFPRQGSGCGCGRGGSFPACRSRGKTRHRTDAAAAADRDAQEAALKARIARIEAAQDSKIIELEDLPANPDDPATQAYRARIRARFAELHDERGRLETQPKALAKTAPAAADTTLLDQLPLAGDILPDLPPQLKARLFAAFDLSVLWNKPGQQATVHAEITETTLQALTGILDPTQDGYHDTDPEQSESIWDLDNPPRSGTVPHPIDCALGRLGLGARTASMVSASAAGLSSR